MASTISFSEISFISPSTIAIESFEAPIIISISDNSNCARDGLMMNLPSILPTLASEINVSKGMSDNANAAEAANPAKASGITSSS